MIIRTLLSRGLNHYFASASQLASQALLPSTSMASHVCSAKLHTSPPLERFRIRDMRDRVRGIGPLQLGDEGTYLTDWHVSSGRFPTLETHDELFDGIPYRELPIIYITVSKNNTIIVVKGQDRNAVCYSSAGVEGYKNARKGTTVAAQAVAVSIAMKAIRRGVKTARVVMRGLGPGRMASIKGLQMTGLNIISITDATPLPELGPRPRLPRSL